MTILLGVLLAADTVFVAPFAVKDQAQSWAGVAAAEAVLDALVQANKDNFLTLKELDAVLRRRDLHIDDAAVAAGAAELARTLGGTHLVAREGSFHGGEAAVAP